MFQLSVIKTPKGNYRFVGNVPAQIAFYSVLEKEISPEIREEICTSSNPSWTMEKYGIKNTSFPTEIEAIEYAKKFGFSIESREVKNV